MNDLIYSCSESLTQAETPVSATDYGERIVRILLSKEEIATTGDVPSASDFSISSDYLLSIEGIVSTHRTFLNETEIEWHHKEWFDKEYRIDGMIVRFDEDVARACEKANIYKNLYLYYITENNYCFGPYYSQPNFTLIQHNGKGSRPHIRFMIDFTGNGIDYSQYDADYENMWIDVDELLNARITEDGHYRITEDGEYRIIE